MQIRPNQCNLNIFWNTVLYDMYDKAWLAEQYGVKNRLDAVML